jgi:hypothetical protein
MNLPRESTGLREIQSRLAAALRALDHGAPACIEFAQAIADDGIPALARLRVYRNNTRLIFVEALRRTYAVVRRRVGDEFFERLAHEYRDAHPSRHGDLHWVGECFPEWLASRLSDSGYEWLADLARLEWACEQAMAAADASPLPLAALGRIAPDRLAETVIAVHPSVRFVSSACPIWSVWQENQPEGAGRSVDLARGAEHVIVAASDDGLALLSVPAEEFEFAAALAEGRTLGDALERAALPVERLPQALGQLFETGLVVGLHAPEQQIAP